MSKSLGNVIDPMHIIEGKSLESLKCDLKSAIDAGTISTAEGKTATKGLEKSFPNGIKPSGADVLRYGLCHLDVSGNYK